MRLLRRASVVLVFGCFLYLIHLAPAQDSKPASDSALTVATMTPAVGAKDVCPDTPLRILFHSAPVLGDSGKIQVCDAADDSVVATIDVTPPPTPEGTDNSGKKRTDPTGGKPTAYKTIGGIPNFRYYPVMLDDVNATLYLPGGALGYNKTYYVKIDAGAFKDKQSNVYAGLNDSKSWRFTTKAAPPAAGSKRLVVAADGTGDFATVQAAIDFVPDGNNEPVTIFIKNGTYNEIIAFTNKNNLTFLGEDRKKTIIAYPNNNNFNNGAGANPFAPGATPTTTALRGVYHRGMFLAHKVNDLTIANLTLHNTTPHGGSQMEAIILNGSPNAHAILTNVDLYAYQDTLQINGQAYISDCYIEGDVDFMWGKGPCFFENCGVKSTRSGGYYTQIRNGLNARGYVYKDCKFDGAPDVKNNFLSRINPNSPGGYPGSEVVLIDCVLTNAVGDVGWQLQGATGTDYPNIHFWEYNSHDPEGKPIDTSKRLAVSKQLKLPDDKETIDNYSDAKWVLGGWTPKAPEEVTAYLNKK